MVPLTRKVRDAIKAEYSLSYGGAVAQLGARLDGIEEVVGSNPIGSTNSAERIPVPPGRSWVRITSAPPGDLKNARRQTGNFV